MNQSISNAARSAGACAILTRMAGRVAAHAADVRRDYATLAQASRLMARHRMTMFEDAVREEARQRALREDWAHTTRAAA
jgi:predicted GIY-YIG superfamily endonuclease